MSTNNTTYPDFDVWKTIENPLLKDCGKMSVISSQSVTVGKAEIQKTMEMKAHHHPQEQVTVVIEGEMEVEYEERRKTVGAGEACIIPGDVEHKVWITKTPFRSFDIFTPIKTDFIENALQNESQ